MDLKKKLRPRRSFIFTPGLRPEMFPKAVKSGVDMVCIELEDGIAPKDKKEAIIYFLRKTKPRAVIRKTLPTAGAKSVGIDLIPNKDFSSNENSFSM